MPPVLRGAPFRFRSHFFHPSSFILHPSAKPGKLGGRLRRHGIRRPAWSPIRPMEVRRFTVLPRLPEKLARLSELAHNLWWSWNPDAIILFRRINENLFAALNHNPVKLLGVERQERLNELASDDGFLAHLDRVWDAFETYFKQKSWFDREGAASPRDMKVAYFSAEFGLHESFPIYSGGLGLLAGDHLKSASDLGLPLIGIGLMYREGYFRQYLNVDGWQQERYPENDFYNLPLIPENKSDGTPLL